MSLALALSFFNLIFIVLLVARPVEVRDSENNTNYVKIFFYSLVLFAIFAVLYFIIYLFSLSRL